MRRNFPQAFVLLVLAIICFAISQSSFASTTAPSPWPGQPGNAVGYAAWTGWVPFSATACPSSPSSGTSWANATVVKNCSYSGSVTISCNYCEFINVDFTGVAGGGNVFVPGSNVLFLADRFQSNEVQAGSVGVTGHYVYFLYDSVVPMVSFYTSPPGYTWPSAGSGANSLNIVEGVNAINGTQGYEYGFNLSSNSGPIWIDHCDIWGFGDAIVIQTVTAGVTITNNHMHDIANPSEQAYHTDGPGYSNGAVGPNNVRIIGNTVAMLGNTNDLALQAATGGYQNLYVAQNFWSGNGGTISWCHPGSVECTNSAFYGNVWATDVEAGGPIYSAGSSIGTGSVWACNTIEVKPGTTWSEYNPPHWAPSSSDDGKYFINADPPNSTTDQGGNTNCGVPTPSSINFGGQAINTSSVAQTITFSSTNTGNLSISSISLATGTQFSVTSNTCQPTLNSGSSCSITVAFVPTAMGPQTDLLKITDSSPGVSSPHLVPLAGIGTSSSNVAPPTGLAAVVQ